jgi:hypothetical protein
VRKLKKDTMTFRYIIGLVTIRYLPKLRIAFIRHMQSEVTSHRGNIRSFSERT